MSIETFKKEIVKIFGSGELPGKHPNNQYSGLLYPRESESREVHSIISIKQKLDTSVCKTRVDPVKIFTLKVLLEFLKIFF